jgi:hypothetical protein
MLTVPKATALNASTYVAITTPAVACYGLSIVISDGSDWKWASDAEGTGEITWPGSLPLNLPNHLMPSTKIMYAKATAGTPNLLILPGEKSEY